MQVTRIQTIYKSVSAVRHQMQDPSNVQHTSNKSTTEGETFTNFALTRSKMMTSSRQNSVTQQLWLRTLVPSINAKAWSKTFLLYGYVNMV